MKALIAYGRALRYPVSGRGITRYFFFSGLLLLGGFAFVLLWSVWAQSVMGADFFAIGSPVEVAVALHGGGLVAGLTFVGFFWLFVTGFVARGAALRERDRTIAEMQAKLTAKNDA